MVSALLYEEQTLTNIPTKRGVHHEATLKLPCLGQGSLGSLDPATLTTCDKLIATLVLYIDMRSGDYEANQFRKRALHQTAGYRVWKQDHEAPGKRYKEPYFLIDRGPLIMQRL